MENNGSIVDIDVSRFRSIESEEGGNPNPTTTTTTPPTNPIKSRVNINVSPNNSLADVLITGDSPNNPRLFADLLNDKF